jgi:hypothetical protein
MKQSPFLMALPMVAALLAPIGPARADTVSVRFSGDLSSTLDVVDVVETDRAVSGVLINRTGDTIKDVRVSVSQMFLWTRDHHPGPDDPSRTTVVTLEQAIPPRGSAPFTVPTAPLPQRSDGRFMTEVAILSLTAWSAPGGNPPTSPAWRSGQ